MKSPANPSTEGPSLYLPLALCFVVLFSACGAPGSGLQQAKPPSSTSADGHSSATTLVAEHNQQRRRAGIVAGALLRASGYDRNLLVAWSTNTAPTDRKIPFNVCTSPTGPCTPSIGPPAQAAYRLLHDSQVGLVLEPQFQSHQDRPIRIRMQDELDRRAGLLPHPPDVEAAAHRSGIAISRQVSPIHARGPQAECLEGLMYLAIQVLPEQWTLPGSATALSGLSVTEDAKEAIEETFPALQLFRCETAAGIYLLALIPDDRDPIVICGRQRKRPDASASGPVFRTVYTRSLRAIEKEVAPATQWVPFDWLELVEVSPAE